jgi:predicted PurR-regulated permease PerM
MEAKKLEMISFLVAAFVVLVFTFFVFQPFFNAIVLSIILAVLFDPLYKKLIAIFGGGKNILAFLLVLLALVFLIIPIMFFGMQILRQAQNFFLLTQGGQFEYAQNIKQGIEVVVRYIFPNFSINLSDYAAKALNFISDHFTDFLSQTLYVFFQTALLLVSFFYFLRNGDDILRSFMSFSPFGKEQSNEILNSTHKTITSVIRGTLFVGLVRWALLMAGFYLFKIPGSIFWGSLGAIIGAIPGIGTPVAIIPAMLYLFIKGKILLAVMIAVYGVLMVFFIDSILSVKLFGRGISAPSIFVLFSIIGGIVFFGPLGFIFGPIVLPLCDSIVAAPCVAPDT